MTPKQKRALETIQEILQHIDFPSRRVTRQTAICIYALLDEQPRERLLAEKRCLAEGARIHNIIEFARRDLAIEVAENTRESYRKQSLKPLLDKGLITRHRSSVNDPNTHYALNKTFESLVRSYLGTKKGVEKQKAISKWTRFAGKLRKAAGSRLETGIITIKTDGEQKTLSPGKHNALIKQIVETFAPIFVDKPKVLYLGDAELKMKHVDPRAEKLGLRLDRHEKLPDVVLYSTSRNIVYIVESVTSAGPINEARILDIEAILFPKSMTFGVEYFTAFPDRRVFKKFLEDIAWGTQVWLAAEPFGVIIFRRVR